MRRGAEPAGCCVGWRVWELREQVLVGRLGFGLLEEVGDFLAGVAEGFVLAPVFYLTQLAPVFYLTQLAPVFYLTQLYSPSALPDSTSPSVLPDSTSPCVELSLHPNRVLYTCI